MDEHVAIMMKPMMKKTLQWPFFTFVSTSVRTRLMNEEYKMKWNCNNIHYCRNKENCIKIRIFIAKNIKLDL